MPHSLPDISVIVATRNRLASLKRCVESMQAQNYPKQHMELIIVNDGSTDDTPKYLAALANQASWVKVASQARGWQASARNTGIALSRGELIAVTDDDCTVAEDWLLSIATAMQDQDISGIGGRVHAPGSSLIARYLDYMRALDPMLLPNGSPRYLVTANACIRRSAFDQIGLFDETFIGGEDTELTLRMRRKGMKLQFVPACHVSHWYEPDSRIFLRRFYHYGFGDRRVFDKHLAWEHWFPHADAILRRLMSDDIKWREFHEVEDTHLRPWYFLFYVLQQLFYLAGYLHLTNVAQLHELRSAGENNRQRGESDAAFTESAALRREQSEAILRVLSADLTPSETGKGYRENELTGWLEQHSYPSPYAMLRMLDYDFLLAMAVPDDLPALSPSTGDNSLSEIQQAAYKVHAKHLRRAYSKQLKGLLREFLHQPECNTLAKIEMLCYARSIDVSRFLAYYGNYLSRVNAHP